MNLRKIIRWSCSAFAGVVISLVIAASSQADLILEADFNDITAGSLNGKGGGTGFSSNWSGSAGGVVVAGDLTSSLYNAVQTGTAQHFRNVNGTGLRQNYRSQTATPLGEIWFSYLAMTNAADSRAGLSLNAPTGSPFDDTDFIYAYLVGNTLNYSFGEGHAGTAAAADVGTTNLIVGKMSIVAGGADSISLWLNPNLMANPDIDSITPIYSSSSVDFIDSLLRIGAVASGSGGSIGGHVDNILFSDGGGDSVQAYYDVTGLTAVPEPSSAILASLGAVALWRSRRRIRSAA